jgi:DNA-binding XRE family transcriptional regulator
MRSTRGCVNVDEDFGGPRCLTRLVPRQPIDDEVRLRRAALGDRLRELRGAAGLSQEATAQAAGMERAFYAKLEAGQHSVLADRLWDLAGALGVDPQELLRPPSRPDS